MHTVIAGRVHDRCLDPRALHAMYRLRHTVFRERLGWEVSSEQGLERDRYDDLEPVYLVVRGAGQRIAGCMRLLPTTGPYMLRDTFPQLLAGEPAPESPGIWDVSRFATLRDGHTDAERGAIRRVTGELIVAAIDYALENRIDHYVAVVSVALERIFRRIGLPTRRFGNQRSQLVGETRSVAIWIEMSEATRGHVLERLLERRVRPQVAAA